MERNTQASHSISADDRLPREDVSRVRNEGLADEQLNADRFAAIDRLNEREYEVSRLAEAERQARAEVEAAHDAALRFTGRKANDDKSARVFARFDAKERGVQPAEFYRYHDAEISRHGYF